MNARVRALTVLVAVFLLGCSVGVFSYRLVRSRIPEGWIGSTPPGTAFNNRSPRTDRGVPRLQQQLGLSAEQQTRFQAIMKEFRPRFEAVRAEEDKKLDPIRAEFDPKFEAVRAEMAPKFEAIRAEMFQRISGILTEEQKTKFEALQKQREARGEGRGGRHRTERPGPPPK